LLLVAAAGEWFKCTSSAHATCVACLLVLFCAYTRWTRSPCCETI
jgi:hypothetical protein